MTRYVICPGFPRSGTSTLFNLLIQHPEVCKPSSKEVGFFITDSTKGLDYYRKKLGVTDDCGVAIDFTPGYISKDSVPSEISAMLGNDVRIIFMVREPLRRLKSHFFMEKRLLHESLTPLEAVRRSEEERISRSLKVFGHRFGFDYVRCSLYGTVIRSYLEIFPVDSIKIVVFEEFIEDIGSHLRDICSFIGVSPDYVFNHEVNRNPTVTASKLDFVDRLGSRINNLPFIRERCWKNGVLRKIAGHLRRKILAYKETEYFNEVEIPDDLKGRIYSDIELLEGIAGRKFDMWRKGSG